MAAVSVSRAPCLPDPPSCSCVWQDIDNFEEWWQRQMGTIGYDGVFAKCDNDRREGYAVC